MSSRLRFGTSLAPLHKPGISPTPARESDRASTEAVLRAKKLRPELAARG